jgi:predicted nuclease of predicted toxin-antitoxin system
VKIKLDENMLQALVHLLCSAGHDVSTVAEEDLSGEEDPLILEWATEEDRLLITFDVGFGDVRAYPMGSHAGVVVVFRLSDQRWAVLKSPVERLRASGLIDRLHQGLAVVDENRIRTRFKGAKP